MDLRRSTRACPCSYTATIEPCKPDCSCAKPLMSGGCNRCCSYGSYEQRLVAAKRIAGNIPHEMVEKLIKAVFSAGFRCGQDNQYSDVPYEHFDKVVHDVIRNADIFSPEAWEDVP